MIHHLQGKIFQKTPTYIVVECNSIGYQVNVSLNTFSAIGDKKECLLFIHEIIREDAYLLFGFATEGERDFFRLLISVSGVGPSTAQMMLSSLSTADLEAAILNGNVNQLKAIKGIGAKTAQRIIVDLKDKISISDQKIDQISLIQDNTCKNEALSALTMLGFNRPAAEKVVNKILNTNPELGVEDVIKRALQQL